MLEAIVTAYLYRFPEESCELTLLMTQLANGDSMNDRATMPGHITGAAFVLSPDRSKLLLVRHKIL